jgi:hypothetical protein
VPHGNARRSAASPCGEDLKMGASPSRARWSSTVLAP